jgi:hypothetical protein
MAARLSGMSRVDFLFALGRFGLSPIAGAVKPKRLRWRKKSTPICVYDNPISRLTTPPVRAILSP